jgi:hypothetical protein
MFLSEPPQNGSRWPTNAPRRRWRGWQSISPCLRLRIGFNAYWPVGPEAPFFHEFMSTKIPGFRQNSVTGRVKESGVSNGSV